ETRTKDFLVGIPGSNRNRHSKRPGGRDCDHRVLPVWLWSNVPGKCGVALKSSAAGTTVGEDFKVICTINFRGGLLVVRDARLKYFAPFSFGEGNNLPP